MSDQQAAIAATLIILLMANAALSVIGGLLLWRIKRQIKQWRREIEAFEQEFDSQTHRFMAALREQHHGS